MNSPIVGQLSTLRKHPRYSIAAGFALFLLLCLAFQGSQPVHQIHSAWSQVKGTAWTTAASLRASEEAWRRSVEKRHALIHSVGGPSKLQGFGSWQYTLWDLFTPDYACPAPYLTERVGKAGDGGKWVCGVGSLARKGSNCVVYTFGINGESSFEAELMQRTQCEVWGYDFSTNQFGPEVAYDSHLKSRLHFFAYGLAGTDRNGTSTDPTMYTLKSLMKMNGHDYIDLIKIDVEGWEFEIVDAIVSDFPGELPFGQLQLEIHTRTLDEKSEVIDPGRFVSWFERLEKVGLRTFSTEINYPSTVHTGPYYVEYSFLNVRSRYNELLNG